MKTMTLCYLYLLIAGTQLNIVSDYKIFISHLAIMAAVYY